MSALLARDHPGKPGDYIHLQLINPARFMFVSYMGWACRYGRHNVLGKCAAVFSDVQISHGEFCIL